MNQIFTLGKQYLPTIAQEHRRVDLSLVTRLSSRGFSSVEMVLVILFLSIVATTGVISWRSAAQRRAVFRAGKEVLSYIDLASELATTSQSDLTISFDEENRELRVESEGSNHAFYLPEPLSLAKHLNISMFFGNLAAQNDSLAIRANGSATPGRIEISDGSVVCVVTQALRGSRRVRCS